MSGVSLTPYLIVKPDYFAYVPVTSRNGNKITIAHNETDNTYIVSSSYIVFYVNRPNILDSDFSRSIKDSQRYLTFGVP